ncbi:MAG: TIGR01620 family protein [Devosia sp.]
MKKPTAFSLDDTNATAAPLRGPRAFAAEDVTDLPDNVVSLSDPDPAPETATVPIGRMTWLARLLWTTGGLIVSLALGLAADRLIRDLFATYPALGWVGLGLVVLFGIALLGLIIREAAALSRLRSLDHLKLEATNALATDRLRDGQSVLGELTTIYAPRADLSGALARMASGQRQLFDGGELIRYGERSLMAPLDARARALTAASARRVALVTAVSPRALVDIAFVVWESIRLGGAIARLYGARPGLFGTWRLIGAILSHLAVTGGLVLTDGIIEQLVGQGLAARLSQRLGEGVVNGLMTVRVGIAAMRVVRPLPFTTEPQPMVKDFLPELANVLKQPAKD